MPNQSPPDDGSSNRKYEAPERITWSNADSFSDAFAKAIIDKSLSWESQQGVTLTQIVDQLLPIISNTVSTVNDWEKLKDTEATNYSNAQASALNKTIAQSNMASALLIDLRKVYAAASSASNSNNVSDYQSFVELMQTAYNTAKTLWWTYDHGASPPPAYYHDIYVANQGIIGLQPSNKSYNLSSVANLVETAIKSTQKYYDGITIESVKTPDNTLNEAAFWTNYGVQTLSSIVNAINTGWTRRAGNYAPGAILDYLIEYAAHNSETVSFEALQEAYKKVMENDGNKDPNSLMAQMQQQWDDSGGRS